MRSLYESLLDNDFDVNDDDMYVSALVNLCKENKSNINPEVQQVDDKYNFTFGGCLILDGGELIRLLKKSPIRKLVFNGMTIINFTGTHTVKDLDISAEELNILSIGKVTFKDCYLRSGEDISFRGSLNAGLVFDNTIAYGLACVLSNINLQLKSPSQLNINYELAIKEPTKAQMTWLKKHNIPLALKDFQNGAPDPDMWTDPMDLIKSNGDVTDYVVISGEKLNYVYKFYSIAPDHIGDEVACHELANGWTLIIDKV